MSTIYDNWERIVRAVLRREELWELFHSDSIPSEDYSSSNFSSSTASSWTGSLSYKKNQKNEEYVEVVSYKLIMDNGITTAVKRLREAKGDDEVIKDENDGYFCYKDDEMLIIYEYKINQDDVSNVMHGKKVDIINSLDWESRLRIAICIAKAIANTHSQCSEKVLKLPNKHIIDLRSRNKAATSVVVRTTSYRAPEINDSCKSSQSSDIYSFGVLLMELLTGKFPMNGNVVRKRHLVRWIIQRFHEVGTLIVYEFVPVKNHTALIEMWKMLLVAIKCVGEDPKHRPESMSDVVKMMEDVRILHP